MTVYDKFELGRMSHETGFPGDNLEKVCRLVEILSYFEQDKLLKKRLVLKGGTAINLTVFSMPRLSVDIDLDFEGDCSKDEMLDFRSKITDDIQSHMTFSGYALHPHTKNPHSLDSFVYKYRNAGGNVDNIKIEINYMMRNHLMPTIEVPVLHGLFPGVRVRRLNTIELFASKIKAFMERHTCRDLYDINQMLANNVIPNTSHDVLRKMVLFYLSVGGSVLPVKSYDLSFCDNIRYHQVRATLLPMLQKKDRFDFVDAVSNVREFLIELLQWTPEEVEFIERFNSGEYAPDLLFADCEMAARVRNHPMAVWKMQNITRGNSELLEPDKEA